MRVLVTGGTGFVGSHAARVLLGAGHDVRLLVRDPAKAERVFGRWELPTPDCVVGDIGDVGSVEKALEGCEAVVHAAAVVAMKAKRAQEVLSTNARGVRNVVGGAVRAGARSIVHVSSIGALFVPDGPVVDGDSPVSAGSSPYACSKAEADLYARSLQAEGAPVHVVYPSMIMGPDDPGLSESMHALRTFCRDVVLLTTSGVQPVDVRDVARVVERLVERPGQGRWIAAGRNLSWAEVADTIDSVTGTRVRRFRISGRLVRASGYLGDTVKRVWDFDFPVTAEGMKFATQWAGADASRTERELGVQFREPAETMADALRWMHGADLIPAQVVGRLARTAP